MLKIRKQHKLKPFLCDCSTLKIFLLLKKWQTRLKNNSASKTTRKKWQEWYEHVNQKFGKLKCQYWLFLMLIVTTPLTIVTKSVLHLFCCCWRVVVWMQIFAVEFPASLLIFDSKSVAFIWWDFSLISSESLIDIYSF